MTEQLDIFAAQLPSTWLYRPVLSQVWRDLIGAPGRDALASALDGLDQAGGTVLPLLPPDCFRAFALVSPANCRCITLGQDPYPNRSHAMGLAFSVPSGIALPRSLSNIYRELEEDLGRPAPTSGDLTGWAMQGVLLANTALTVLEGQAGIHAKRWAAFTRAWITALGNDGSPRVWLLWGNHAQAFKPLIGPGNIILESAHPSPLSARRGFFGSRPFSKVNDALARLERAPVRWA